MPDIAVSRVADIDALATSAAKDVATLLVDVAERGGLHGDSFARLVVTGGTAGMGLLAALADDSLAIDWSHVHVLFGDERNVPVDHEDSNEGQARRALLDHVNIPEQNIHGYHFGEADFRDQVEAYAETVANVAPQGFDLHLLGMGPEGHINSLFPHTAAVAEQERQVVAVPDSPKPPSERGSLTLPAVARAERVWFLVSGEEKGEAARHVLDGADPTEWPAAGAHGTAETRMFIDDAAARAAGL